jgi:hypothetical protein
MSNIKSIATMNNVKSDIKSITTMNNINSDIISFMNQYEGSELVHIAYSYILQRPIETVDIRLLKTLIITGKKMLIEHTCTDEIRDIILNFLQLYENHQV